MKVVDDKIPRKDHKKLNYLRPKLDFYDKKIKTKTNSHQIEPKQNNLTYTSLEKIWELSSIRLVNRTKEQKSSKIRHYF